VPRETHRRSTIARRSSPSRRHHASRSLEKTGNRKRPRSDCSSHLPGCRLSAAVALNRLFDKGDRGCNCRGYIQIAGI
jgi:hypothetical protein